MIDSVRMLLRLSAARRPDVSRSCPICAARDITSPADCPLAQHRAALDRLHGRRAGPPLSAHHPRLRRLGGYVG